MYFLTDLVSIILEATKGFVMKFEDGSQILYTS